MGYSSRAENILLCLGALGSVLAEAGHRADVGAALGAAQSALEA
jgi:alanine-glyoxylate transaminase/serine-glyoxylate transaminase/serine-pyruvate transaminase